MARVKLWQGAKHEYDALEEKDSDTCYMITDPDPVGIGLAGGSSLSYISINDTISTYAPYIPSSVRYVCEYCGSEYYSDGGFVPPCNGCGARLRRASDIE